MKMLRCIAVIITVHIIRMRIAMSSCDRTKIYKSTKIKASSSATIALIPHQSSFSLIAENSALNSQSVHFAVQTAN